MKNPMKKGRLDTSPSQITTYIDCPRKWWLKHIIGLPEPQKEVTRIGDVGHSVIERFLKGEQDLYPADWHTPRNRWTHEPEGDPISPADQALVKALIHNGIQNGVLTREPDGVVEQEIVLEPAAVPVRIRMFLDYATQHAVIDHKFCGNTRYYGPDKLKLALPMNLYAAAKYINGDITEPTVWLRYNLFVKDPQRPMVKPVNVERRQEDILAHFQDTVLPACAGMFKLYERTATEDAPLVGDDWALVASPDNPNTCNNYGGCPFQSVCTGQCSVAQYSISMSSPGGGERLEKEKQALARLTGGKQGEEAGMDFRAKVKAMREAGQSGAATAVTQAAPVQAPVEPTRQEPAAPVHQEGDTAPWYQEGCKACSSNPVRGFSTSGKPCAICGMVARKSGQPTPDAYTISVGNDGVISVSKDGKVLMGTAAPQVATAPEQVTTVQPELPSVQEPEPELPSVQEPEPEQVQEPEPKPETPAQAEPPKRKRRTKAEIEADRQAAAEAKAQQAPEQEPEQEQASVQGAPVCTREDSLGDLRREVYDFTISYAPVRLRGRNSRTLGDCDCVAHISELLEMVQANVCEAEGVEAGKYYEINAFRRRDIIMQNAEVIARAIGGSVVDASCAQRATDEAILCQALERFANMVMGQLSA